MIIDLYGALMLCGLLCLFLAAIGIPTPRVSLGWLGMFFWMLAVMLHGRGLR